MNIIKKLSFFALACLLLTGCKDNSKDGTIEETENGTVTDSTMVKETAANLETTSFKIDGMTCPMGCAATIEKKLAGLDGVQEAKVDFDTKTATISFDAGRQTPETLVETVEKIADGAYKVHDVKSSGDKAYYKADQEKEKKGKTSKEEKDNKTSKSSKGSCCADKAKAGKKGGCCADEGKKSCSSESKGGKI